jgi:hypothetical protein
MQVFDVATTQAEIVAQEILRSKNRINYSFLAEVKAYKNEFDAFWRNPKATPHELATAWGTDALLLFQNSEIKKNCMLQIDPDCLGADYESAPLAWSPEQVNGQYTGRIIIE